MAKDFFHVGDFSATDRRDRTVQREWRKTCALCVCLCVCVHSGVTDPLRPHGLYSPGSSVLGILQARILEWVATSSSRGSSRPRDRTRVTCISRIGRCVLYH